MSVIKIESRFKVWLDKSDPEGITNRDAIQMVITLVVGLGITFGLIFWATGNCNC